MTDRNVTLVGSEDVVRAASSMRSSAETIERAASSLSYGLEQHQRFMDDWLQRFEAALAEFAQALKENTP